MVPSTLQYPGSAGTGMPLAVTPAPAAATGSAEEIFAPPVGKAIAFAGMVSDARPAQGSCPVRARALPNAVMNTNEAIRAHVRRPLLIEESLQTRTRWPDSIAWAD